MEKKNDEFLEKFAFFMFNKNVPIDQKIKNILAGVVGGVPLGIGGLVLWNALRNKKEQQEDKVRGYFAGTGLNYGQ